MGAFVFKRSQLATSVCLPVDDRDQVGQRKGLHNVGYVFLGGAGISLNPLLNPIECMSLVALRCSHPSFPFLPLPSGP